MTIQGALDMADQLKPNMMTRGAKITFLNEIEGIIHGELILTHAHTAAQESWTAYSTETDPGTELLIPAPYDMLYPYWLMSKIDHQNMEMDKYNNDRALFENAYQQAADWINRTKRPLSPVKELRI